MPDRPSAPSSKVTANTHYAVLVFSGDLDEEHPDPDLNGSGPRMELIAAGPEDFCWQALADWTAEHPLRMWEDAEVLARHESVVRPFDRGASEGRTS